ncbi:MAG TPA: sigma-70 family RNA polymerase sigma factor [Flavisolibacter sp.]|jgi:RNA polymerase sigma factor (sigma-70 family)|nr:sigma-70 family RNA polymerase sigma factor [Flavisolibacter sp.]
MKPSEQELLIGIYRDAFPAAVQLIRRMGGSAEEAKDAFHDALLIYLERNATGSLQVRTSVKAYLIGITRILWLHSRNETVTLLPEEVESFVEEEREEEEEEKRLLDYLVLAGKKCMDILKAFYYDRLTLPEIAERFGFNSIRSATVQKHKCMEKIRNEVKKRNVYEERT